MISGFNTEREVAQLRIAQEFHLERIEEIKQYIEELEELMVPASGKTEKMYTFVKLGRRVDYHKKRMAEIAARICLLRKEAEQQDESVEVRQCNGTTVDGDPCGALIRDPDEDERFCDPHKGQQDDLTQVSGVGEDEEQILKASGYKTLDDLREATQQELAKVRIGNALAVRIKADVGDSEQDSEEELNLFDPNDWPPQFHLDNLEMQLDFNLGEVHRFDDLDWKSKCDLARLAVDNDLSIEECETILDLNQGDESRGVSC